MTTKNRFQTRRERQNKIRRMIKEGPTTWKKLLSELQVSPATLSQDLERLITNKEIQAHKNPEDRRITWYEAIGDIIDNEIKRHEALEFIESIEDPLTVHKQSEDKTSTVSIFMGPVEEQYREGMRKVVLMWAQSFFPMWNKGVKTVRPGQKIAVVLTREKS